MGWDFLSIALLGVLALLLVSAAVEDLSHREIADWKNGAIALLAPLFWWSQGLPVWPIVALQIGIALALFGAFTLAFMIGQMGGGDVKMIGAVALWFPWTPLVDLIILMAVAGGVLTLVYLIDKLIRRSKTQVEVPYGVAIAIGGLLTLHQLNFNHF